MKGKVSNSLFPMQVSPLDFRVGDPVKKLSPRDCITDVIGVVSHILPKTYKVRVQWPYGNEAEDPEMLYKVPAHIFPPMGSFNSAYNSYETTLSERNYGSLPRRPRIASRIAVAYVDRIATIVKEIEKYKTAGLPAERAYIEITHRLNKVAGSALLSELVASVYAEE